eukprot:scaffold72114_cov58-Phaeocystis_antarctica.AAC.4
MLRQGGGVEPVKAASKGRDGDCWVERKAARRLRKGRALPHPRPAPRPKPHASLCVIAHLVLEARVSPRLEQRLDAGNVALRNCVVQRSVLALPRRRGGPTHARERLRRAV